MAAITKEIVTAGPALWAAAPPVMEKSPAPIIAPMPSATKLGAPNVRFKLCSEEFPCTPCSSCKSVMDLTNRELKIINPPKNECI